MAERTELELKNSEYNYFILLGIAPYEEDVAVIKAAFQKKSNTWVKSKSAQAKRYSELQKNVQFVMVENADARREEAERAREFLLSEAVETAKIYCETGKIAKTTLEELAKQYCVTKDEKDTYDLIYQKISGLIAPNGPVAFDTGTGAANVSNDPRLQKYKDMENIEDYLDTYRNVRDKDIQNFYDFLGVSSDSTEAEIVAASEKIKAKYKGKSDAEATAAGKLTGSACLRYVTDASLRKEYDIFLGSTKLWHTLQVYKKQKQRDMENSVYLKYMNQLMTSCNISQKDAENELMLMCSYFGISLTSENKKLKLSICPFCGVAFEASSASSCPKCAKSLIYSCWNCKTDNNVLNDKICKSCGANPLTQSAFFNDVATINKLLVSPTRNLIDIKTVLQSAKGYAGKIDGSTEIGKYLSTVERQIDLIEKDEAAKNQRHIESDKLKNEVLRLKSIGKLESAFAKLQAIEASDSSYPVADIKKDLQLLKLSADRLVSQAQNAVGSAKIEYALKALKINIESSDAIGILRAFKPESVTAVSVTSDAKGNLIKWNASKTDKVQYTVIRKVGAVPVSISDGDILVKDLRLTSYCDRSASPAVPYYYAVFATMSYQVGVSKENVYSKAACSAETIFFAALEDVESRVTDEGLQVRWKKPDGVSEIIVRRNDKPTPPQHMDEGIQIKTDETGFVDRTLKSTGLYGYLMTCCYVINGKRYYSESVKKSFRFYTLPCALEKVEWSLAKKAGDYTGVRFSGGKEGVFDAFWCESQRRDIEIGKYYTIDELKAFGLHDVDCRDVTADKARFALPSDVFDCYVYPASTINEGGVLGDPVHFFIISDFKDVSIQPEKDAKVSIRMQWTNNADFCVIAVGTNGCPKTLTDGSEQIRLSKAQFEKDKKFVITLKKQCNYLTVFSEFTVDGEKEYSAGIPIERAFDFREQLQVNYSAVFVPSVVKRFKVKFEFQCDAECGELPEIVIVRSKWFDSKQYDSDSEEVGTMRVTLKKKLFSSTYVGEHVFTSEPLRTTKAFFKLYFRDSSVRVKLIPKFKS